LFREVNERIEEAISKLATFHEFVCECAEVECSETTSLTADEYEEIRGHPARFAIKPGHDLPGVERVVAGEGDRYVVVEKIERAAEVAAHLDPRSRAKV
jgi:hypothetical protein